MRRTIRTLVLSLILTMAMAPAALAVQPTGVANADDRNGGASAPGPHCHFVLAADGKSPFGRILTGATHQAHVVTGLPTGQFQATACIQE